MAMDVDIERVRRLAVDLKAGDAAMLADAIDLCGADPGFKARLEHAFVGTYDVDRLGRLRRLIESLTESELLWVCENRVDLVRRRRR